MRTSAFCVDRLGVVDPPQVHGGDPEIVMLALDDDQRHALARLLASTDAVRMVPTRGSALLVVARCGRLQCAGRGLLDSVDSASQRGCDDLARVRFRGS